MISVILRQLVFIPITYNEKAVSDFQIDNGVQYVKCCENSKLMKIDSGMYNMVKKLNSSGVKTAASCELHPFKDYDMYIAFDVSNIPLTYLTNVINRMRYESASSFMEEFELFFEFDSRSSSYNYYVRIRRDAYIAVVEEDGFLLAKKKMLKMLDIFCNELVNFFK